MTEEFYTAFPGFWAPSPSRGIQGTISREERGAQASETLLPLLTSVQESLRDTLTESLGEEKPPDQIIDNTIYYCI